MIIERFLDWVGSASVSKRAEATDALARAYLYSDLSEEERDSAEAALTLLLDDPSGDVRAALANVFSTSHEAPRHIVTALADDIAEIATLVLSRSPVFLDVELVDLVATGTPEQQIAIACRPIVSAAITAAIAEVGCEEACLGLLMNSAVTLNRQMLRRIAGRHGTDASIRNSLLDRSDLPGEIRVILIDKLGEALGGLVSERSWMSGSRANSAISEACAKASIQFAASGSDDELDRMIADMISEGRLTSAYLLRAICMGNISLFARAMGQLSGQPSQRVEYVLSRNKRSAFRAVYDKAGLPARAFGVFHDTVSAWREELQQETAIDAAKLPYKITRKVLSTYRGDQNAIADDLLLLLRKISAEAARDSALATVENLKRKAAEPLLLEDASGLDAEIELAVQEEFDKLEGELELDFDQEIDEDLVEEFAVQLEAEMAGDAAQLEDASSFDDDGTFAAVEFSGPRSASAPDVQPVDISTAAANDVEDIDFDQVKAKPEGSLLSRWSAGSADHEVAEAKAAQEQAAEMAKASVNRAMERFMSQHASLLSTITEQASSTQTREPAAVAEPHQDVSSERRAA